MILKKNELLDCRCLLYCCCNSSNEILIPVNVRLTLNKFCNIYKKNMKFCEAFCLSLVTRPNDGREVQPVATAIGATFSLSPQQWARQRNVWAITVILQ